MDKFGVAGDPVDASLSPQLHTHILNILEIPAEYGRYAIRHLADSGIINSPDLRGLSITTPLKDQAFALSSSHDHISGIARAANTLSLKKGEVVAGNTDGPATVDTLKRLDIPEKASCLVLGGGGAARAVAAACDESGYTVKMAVRRPDKLNWFSSILDMEIISLAEECPAVDVVINATSAFDAVLNQELVDWIILSRASHLVSLHYQTKDSILSSAAGAMKAAFTDGRTPFIFQALRQAEIWHGKAISFSRAREFLDAVCGELFD